MAADWRSIPKIDAHVHVLATYKPMVPFEDTGRVDRLPHLMDDSGVEKAFEGLDTEAAGIFEKAISADPHYLPAYASLGAVYISQNETKKVIMLYERALEINKDKRNSALYKLLGKDLEKLKAGAGGSPSPKAEGSPGP